MLAGILALAMVFGFAGCSATKNRELASSNTSSKVELLVSGDMNCDPQKKPEPFTVFMEDRYPIDGVHSATVLAPAAFLDAPFSPSASDRTFLQSISADTKLLKDADNLTKYKNIAEKLFADSFSAPVETRAVASKRGAVVYMHPMQLKELMAFQSWYFEKLAPKTNRLLAVTTNGNPDEPLLPLLLFGSISQTGKAPNFSVQFDPEDTVITGNAQNEAHDTTLCQLRVGIISAKRLPQADITIMRVQSVGH